MKRYIKKISLLTGIVACISFGLATGFSSPVHAACDNPANAQEAIRCGADKTGKPTCEATDDAGRAIANPTAQQCVDGTVKRVVNIFSLVVGIVAVIMIIFGGFRYITSAGDSGKLAAAKNTIIYAIVGLIIVALAQFIVRFVIDEV